jgi:hypothetical protein
LVNKQGKQKGKEDSAVGCHFGWSEFGLRGALLEMYVECGAKQSKLLFHLPACLLQSYGTCT